MPCYAKGYNKIPYKMKTQLKIVNMSMAIITGTATPGDGGRKLDIWDYEPGVLFFRDIVVLLTPKEIKKELFHATGKRRKHSGHQ